MQTSQTSDHYQADHLIAKVAVYLAYIAVGIISIELANPYVALVFGTAVWLFGVNSAAYCVETLRGHDHSHNLL